jgi:hypothetical protein
MDHQTTTPPKRGGRVRYTGDKSGPKLGTITKVEPNGYVYIRIDGQRHPLPFHPTWKLEYLADEVPS